MSEKTVQVIFLTLVNVTLFGAIQWCLIDIIFFTPVFDVIHNRFPQNNCSESIPSLYCVSSKRNFIFHYQHLISCLAKQCANLSWFDATSKYMYWKLVLWTQDCILRMTWGCCQNLPLALCCDGFVFSVVWCYPCWAVMISSLLWG